VEKAVLLIVAYGQLNEGKGKLGSAVSFAVRRKRCTKQTNVARESRVRSGFGRKDEAALP
jgi:hypothetical protein